MSPLIKLQFAFIASGIAGMIVLFFASYFFNQMGWGSISPSTVAIPWFVSGTLIIPAAFKSGSNSKKAEQDAAANP